jgi:hypothetical protein
MMFALGCIQSLRCNTNTCPTGIATQDRKRARAVNVKTRQINVASFHAATVESFRELVGAVGLEDPDQLTPDLIFQRDADETELAFNELYEYLDEGELIAGTSKPEYASHWEKASAEAF